MDKGNIKHLLLNTFYFTLLAFLPSVSAFFILPFILHQLSSEQYGQYVLLNALVPLFSLIGSVGIGSSVITHYYNYNKNSSDLKQYKSGIYSFLFISFMVTLLVSFLCGNYIFKTVFKSDDIRFYPYGIYTLIGAIAGNIFSVHNIFLRNDKNVKQFTVLIFLQVGLTIILQITFIKLFADKLKGLLYGRMTANLIILMFIAGQSIILYKISFPLEILKKGLRFSVFYLPASLLAFLNSFIDKYTFERLLSFKELGIYGLLITLSGIIEMTYLGISSGIQPYLFERLKERKNDYNLLVDIFIYVTLLSSCAVIVIGYNISWFSDKQEYYVIQEYIALTCIAFFTGVYAYIYNLHFFFYNKPGYISIINLITMTVFAILCIILIPLLGIYGCLIALLLHRFLSTIVSKIFYYYCSTNPIFHPKDFTPVMALFSLCLLIHYGFINQYYPVAIATLLQIILFTGVILIKYFGIKKKYGSHRTSLIE